MSIRKRTWQTQDGKEAVGWLVEIKKRIPGQRPIRINKQFKRKAEAEAFERQTLASIAAGTFELNPVAQIDQTLEEFIEDFLKDASNNNKASTLGTKKSILRDHVLPYFGKVKLREIKTEDIESFKAHLKAKTSAGTRATKPDASKWAIKKRKGAVPKPLSVKTINNILGTLNRVLTLAVEYRRIEAAPRVKWLKAAKEDELRYLTFGQAALLESSADPEWRCAITLALKSGLRQGELIGLQWGDVDLDLGRLNVRRTVYRGVEGTPKGGRSRIVDLPTVALEALRNHPRNGPYVFQREGERLTPGKLNVGLRRALRGSGMELEWPLGWHALRHTYASHLAMRGVPLVSIQRLMGHATLEMTQRYAHLSPETLQAAVAVLDLPVPATPAPLSDKRPTLGVDSVGK